MRPPSPKTLTLPCPSGARPSKHQTNKQNIKQTIRQTNKQTNKQTPESRQTIKQTIKQNETNNLSRCSMRQDMLKHASSQ
jgi:hypothetical protein